MRLCEARKNRSEIRNELRMISRDVQGLVTERAGATHAL